MKTDLFDFELPSKLIAKRPVSPRDSARLLSVTGVLADHYVQDLAPFHLNYVVEYASSWPDNQLLLHPAS